MPDLDVKDTRWVDRAFLQQMFADLFDERSSLYDLVFEVRQTYLSDAKAFSLAQSHFEDVFPEFDIYFEKVLVNHLFFIQFPFQRGMPGEEDAWLALYGMYHLLGHMVIGWMRNKQDISQLIDVLARMFRVIGHTTFDRKIVHWMKSNAF